MMSGKIKNAQQKELFQQRLTDLIVDYGTCRYAQGLWHESSPEDDERESNEAFGHLDDIRDLLQDFLWN